MARIPKAQKVQKIRLERKPGESSNAFKNRQNDAKRAEFQRVKDANAERDRLIREAADPKNSKKKGDSDDQELEHYTSEKKGRFGRRSTGGH